MAVASSTRERKAPAEKKDSKDTKKRSHVVDDGDDDGEKTKRAKCPGVRVIGKRIYDSENGRTCHQCRQKTMDLSASCKNLKGNKPCTIKFCHKCLLNRYGEKAEEMQMLDEWKCPKCRGICNCSFCMKKRGHKPTGQLVQTARNAGFSSVSEMLNIKCPDNLGQEKTVENIGVSPKKPFASYKGPEVVSPRKMGKENSLGETDADLTSEKLATEGGVKKSKKTKREGLKEMRNGSRPDGAHPNRSSPIKHRPSGEISKNVKKNGKDSSVLSKKKNSKTAVSNDVPFDHIKSENSKDAKIQQDALASNALKTKSAGPKSKKVRVPCKVKKSTMNLENTEFEAEIPLPQGASLVSIADIELAPEDVGHALQLLEFCAAFGKILDVKKGRAESLLRELKYGRRGRRAQYSMTVHFHIQLLSLIQKDAGKEDVSSTPTNGRNSWWQALGECISESLCVPKELQLDCFDSGFDEYDNLDFSTKLRILNFLCDEALGTRKLRSWIYDQNSKVVAQEKGEKEKLMASKEKEKQLKKKLQDEVAKSIIAKRGASLSISEHETIISQIKNETAQAHAEMLEAMGMVYKRKTRFDALRTEAIFLDVNGRAFWKLKGYTGDEDVLLQDMGTWDAVASDEKWFVYGAEQKPATEQYISSIRRKRLRVQNVAPAISSGYNEASI